MAQTDPPTLAAPRIRAAACTVAEVWAANPQMSICCLPWRSVPEVIGATDASVQIDAAASIVGLGRCLSPRNAVQARIDGYAYDAQRIGSKGQR